MARSSQSRHTKTCAQPPLEQFQSSEEMVNSYDDPDNRITVTTEEIKEIFESNRKLLFLVSDISLAREYGESLCEYVGELFIEMIKKSHSKPHQQNAFLDESNAKYAKVLSSTGQWEMRLIEDVHKGFFENASKKITNIACSDRERKILGLEIEASATKLPSCFRCNRNKILKETEEKMKKHLEEMRNKTRIEGIKIAPIVLSVSTPLPTPKKSPGITDADIKKTVALFVQNSKEDVKDWEIHSEKALQQILSILGATKIIGKQKEELVGTIERYLWEMGNDESLEERVQATALRLSNMYSKKLQDSVR